MKAMVLEKGAPIESKPLTLREVVEPQPGARQVRLKVEACGICHTDLHEIEAELSLPKLPLIPGHQVVGCIDKLGAGVGHLRLGARAGLAWLGSTCGKCDCCRSGKENLCPQARFTGYHFDGGYAEYVLAEADHVYPIPGKMAAAAAAPLLCAGIIGYRALRLSGIQKGERLGLYGFGASAHIAIQIARYWDCQVFVFSRSAQHGELARRLGAAWTGGIDDELPEKLHAGIIFAPAGELVPTALEHLEKGGICVLAGIYLSRIPPLDYEKHLYYEKTLRSVTASTRRDGCELMCLAEKANIQTTTETFPLEQANVALQRLKAGQINGAGVLDINR